jgi:hypothetical protein
LAKGALGSSEKVLQIVVNAANTPEVIREIRNVMILAKSPTRSIRICSNLRPKLCLKD